METISELKEKQQFFTQYWSQSVVNNGEWETPLTLRVTSMEGDLKKDYLLLKDPKDISPEDAIQLCNIGEMFTEENFCNALSEGGDYIRNIQDTLPMIDFLRSKGYVTPWRNYSIVQLIEKGWVKIKQKEDDK